jgi:hypothetical protein
LVLNFFDAHLNQIAKEKEYLWNEGKPIVYENGEEQTLHCHPRLVMLNNSTESKDVIRPYLMHYRKPNERLPCGHPVAWNLRYSTRKVYTMRMGEWPKVR